MDSRKLVRIYMGGKSDPRRWAISPIWMFLALDAGYRLSNHARRVMNGTLGVGRNFVVCFAAILWIGLSNTWL